MGRRLLLLSPTWRFSCFPSSLQQALHREPSSRMSSSRSSVCENFDRAIDHLIWSSWQPWWLLLLCWSRTRVIDWLIMIDKHHQLIMLTTSKCCSGTHVEREWNQRRAPVLMEEPLNLVSVAIVQKAPVEIVSSLLPVLALMDPSRICQLNKMWRSYSSLVCSMWTA